MDDNNVNEQGLDKVYSLVDTETGKGLDLNGTQVRVITYALTLLFSAGTTDNPLAALYAVDTATQLTDDLQFDPEDLAELARELVTFHAPTLAAESEELAKSHRLAEHAQYN